MRDHSKTLLIFALAYLFFRFGPAIPISSVVSQKQSLFEVSGVGKVTVVPDTAIVGLGILSQQSSVKAAQTQANTVINAISQSLKELGIDPKDIKTDNYSIYPQYDYASGRSRISGYQVNISLTVTVQELDKVNSVIDTATAKGANTVSNIQLTVDDKRQKELVQQARSDAVQDAKAKAESLSRAAGLTLVRIVNVQESSPSSPRPIFMALDKAGIGGGGDTQIQPGSTDITSSITLTYETR